RHGSGRWRLAQRRRWLAALQPAALAGLVAGESPPLPGACRPVVEHPSAPAPPHLHQRLMAAIAAGQVDGTAGALDHFEPGLRGGVRAIIRPRGTTSTIPYDVARVYDCGGVTVDVARSSNPTITALIASGRGRPDPQRIGL